MGLLKIAWNYVMEIGDELIPKKRYAFAAGFVLALLGSWMFFG
jgi:hypothetical protein